MITYRRGSTGFTLIIFLFTCYAISAQSKSDSLLLALQAFIEKKDEFVELKANRIQNLKKQLESGSNLTTTQKFDLFNKLYHEYKVFIYDSAFNYSIRMSQAAHQLNDVGLINYSKAKLCFILVSSGMFKEYFDSAKMINIKVLPDSSKLDCYWLKGRAYFDLGTYNGDLYYNQMYVDLGLQFLDSALLYCKPGTYNYLYYSNYKNMMNGNSDKALTEVSMLLSKLPLTNHQRAINNHHLGSIYLSKGETEKALEAFIVASISDIRAAVKENAALNSVADILYKRGDIKTAYLLIEEAMKDALFYGAKQRKIEIGSILPIIADAELRVVESQRKAWLIYSSIITFLGVLVLIFIFVIARQIKKRRAAEKLIIEANQNLQEINRQLREADRIKEEYIGYYFNINSVYIEKTEEVLQAIDQKLSAKKFDDIRYILNNFNLKREREELFVNFDKVFMKLFPDFVRIFNSHFKGEDQVTLKDNQMLSPELRIYALIRMGIHDTEKIARILGYSVNTIYTYKTKVRSKVVTPKDEFEKKIMEIETV